MLKGTTRIELTDIHTGEKEIIEEHNMVTNALSNIFQLTFGPYTSYTNMKGWTPGQNNLFGGLLLFNTALTENANTLYAPAGVALTGHAAYNYTVPATINTTKMGNYSSEDSSFDPVNKTMTFVYDFGTARGNGVISSVCLTSLLAGYGVYGTDVVWSDAKQLSVALNTDSYTDNRQVLLPGTASNSRISTGTEYRFLLDVDNDRVYLFKLTDSTNITIIKRNARIKNRSLFNNDFTVTDSQELTALQNAIGSIAYYNYDSATDCLYIMSTTNYTVASNGTMLITKINITNNTVNQYTVTNKTGETLIFSVGNDSNSRDVVCHQDYLYIKNNTSPYNIYKIDITNSNTYTKLTGTFTNQRIHPSIAINGKIYWQYYYNISGYTPSRIMYITDSQLNTTVLSGNNLIEGIYQNDTYDAACTVIKNHPMFYHAARGTTNGQIFVLGSYLATINNLAQPVTKTADRTMKITYIIEESPSNT